MADLVPYREQTFVPSSFESMGSGLLYRNKPLHWCSPPGLFKCWFNRIKTNDLWFCPCGRGTFRRINMWQWGANWHRFSRETIQETCERQGIEYIESPYKKERQDV